MGATKTNFNSKKYKPSGSLKKSGVVNRRFLFSGFDSVTNAEHIFFIEYSTINPWLSPDKAELGFKSRPKLTENDLQYALAGTQAAHELMTESFVLPSYAVVRVGMLGTGSKQLAQYVGIKNIQTSNKEFLIKTDSFMFSEDHLLGKIEYTESEINSHPEYNCNPGSMIWDLRYEIKPAGITPGYSGKKEKWFVSGAQTVFAGTIILDGTKYQISPRTSNGYIDLSWGESFPFPYFHISCSNMTSEISGRKLFDSAFAVHGIYNERPSVIVQLESQKIEFAADSSVRAYECFADCTLMPEDDNGEKLHWSVSANSKTWVVDIDIYCDSKLLFVRDFELPEGDRKVLKILTGGNGSGEIRLYRKIKKTLELIENAKIEHAFCEYGRDDSLSGISR